MAWHGMAWHGMVWPPFQKPPKYKFFGNVFYGLFHLSHEAMGERETGSSSGGLFTEILSKNNFIMITRNM